MDSSLQRRRKELIPFISDNNLLLSEYDRKKLREYSKVKDENGLLTEYELVHIDRMYEKVMKELTGLGVEVKKDPVKGVLRYG